MRYVTRNLAAGIAAGALLIAAQSIAAAQDRGSVQGVVSDASGQPVAGAFVKLKNDLRRVVVKRSSHDDWDHTVTRMRTRMTVASIPDLTEPEFTTVVNYLSTKFPLVQPYDPNSRLPRTLLTGKAVHYRAVTYDLVN